MRRRIACHNALLDVDGPSGVQVDWRPRQMDELRLASAESMNGILAFWRALGVPRTLFLALWLTPVFAGGVSSAQQPVGPELFGDPLQIISQAETLANAGDNAESLKQLGMSR